MHLAEEDALLRDLESLRVSSASALKVDHAVDDKIDRDRRLALVGNLQLVFTKLQRDLALGSLVVVERPLVRSHPSLVPPHNLVQEVEFSSARITTPMVLSSERGLAAVDTRFDRTLLLDEFSRRFDVLVSKVSDGSFDDLLGYQATVLIHAVMGQSGELLNRLGIDPRAGETYSMLMAETRLKDQVEEKKSMPSIDFEKAGTAIGNIIVNFLAYRQAKNPPKPPVSPPVPDGIGMVTFPVNDQNLPGIGLAEGQVGLLVIEVFPNSLAERGGLRAGKTQAVFIDRPGFLGGDIIVGIGDQPLINTTDLRDYLNRYHKRGDPIKLNIIRDRKPMDVFLIY
jgi:hypothetical protein